MWGIESKLYMYNLSLSWFCVFIFVWWYWWYQKITYMARNWTDNDMALARSSCPKNVVIEQIKAWQSRKKIFNRRQPLLSDWHAQIQFLRGRTFAASGTSVRVLQKKCAMMAYIKSNNMSFVHPLSLAPAHSAYAAAVSMALLHGMCVKDVCTVLSCTAKRKEHGGGKQQEWWRWLAGCSDSFPIFWAGAASCSVRLLSYVVQRALTVWHLQGFGHRLPRHFFLVCGIENARLVLVTLSHSGWVWQTHAAHSRLII